MAAEHDLRTSTSLVAGATAVAIAAATLLRGRLRATQTYFAGFAGAVGLWYLSQSFFGYFQAAALARATQVLAVLLPQAALHLFESMVPHERPVSSRLLRIARAAALPTLALTLSPAAPEPWARVVLFTYVFALLTAGLVTLDARGRSSASRATQQRVRVVVLSGGLAAVASVADFVWILGAELPPIGAVLAVVFLFVLSHAIHVQRVLDVYELLSRLLVATALAFVIAGVFYALVAASGGFGRIYLMAVVAAIVVILLFDPLRQRVEQEFERLFFRERFALESALAEAQQRLVRTLEPTEMAQVAVEALERSRRVTHAAVYLRDPEGTGFDRLAGVGARVPERIEAAMVRPILDRLEQGTLRLEEVERDAAEREARGELPDPAQEGIRGAADVLGALGRATVLGLRSGGGELVGLLFAHDERLRDALGPDEHPALERLATQASVVLENSRAYAQLKERDRLAVLGQMAAGLAHEIRNPLGAIKGAAQLLGEPSPSSSGANEGGEFLGIILEEVDRLDRVVSRVLDLARPGASLTHGACDVNAVVRRTVQLLAAEPTEELTTELVLDRDVPRARIDAESLRQVLMNLHRNAAQAMSGRGKITITTRVRFGRGTRSGRKTLSGTERAATGTRDEETYAELTVADNGPGMSKTMLEKIFLPFFTTKQDGTGLGLAISHRIVQAAGGRMEVRSYEGRGSQFTLILHAEPPPLQGGPSLAPPSEARENQAHRDRNDANGAPVENRG
jgi:two-component system sensor histidine kinase HydH